MYIGQLYYYLTTESTYIFLKIEHIQTILYNLLCLSPVDGGNQAICHKIETFSLLASICPCRLFISYSAKLYWKILKKVVWWFLNYSYFQITTIKGQVCWRFVLNSSFLNPPWFLLKPLSIYGNFGPKLVNFRIKKNTLQNWQL